MPLSPEEQQELAELEELEALEAQYGEKPVPPQPDMAPIKEFIQTNLKKLEGEATEGAPAGQTPVVMDSLPGQPPGQLEQADGFWKAFEAGLEMSVSGLAIRRELPNTVLPEHAPTYMRIASQVGTLAGDIPAMFVGGMGGAVVGAAGGAAVGGAVANLPGLIGGAAAGTGVGTAAGAMALPAGIRQWLVDQYEKGSVQTFSDGWERISAAFIEAAKGGTIGAATAGTGMVVGRVAGAVAPVIKTPASMASEVAAMTVVGKGLEGHTPNAQDFIDAAILVGGLHAVGKGSAKGAEHMAAKLRRIYAKTGVPPKQVAQHAHADPIVRQELAAKNVDLPKQYEPLVQKTANEKVRAQIGEKVEPKAELELSYSEFYKNRVDKFDPIHRATEVLKGDKAELPADQNPYLLARMANDYKAKTKYVLEKGTLDFKTLEKKGKSYTEAVHPYKQELAGLSEYLVSKRVLEVSERGIETGVDLAAAAEVVKTGKKFDKAAVELVEFQNSMVDYAVDAGILSKKSGEQMKAKGVAYIPLKRVLEEGEIAGSGKKPGSFKALKGSDKKIQDPLLTIPENVEAIFQLAERNRAVEAFVTLAEKSGEKGIIEKVPQKNVPVEIKADEVAKFFKEHGIEAEPEAFTVFRPQSKRLGPNEFEVFRGGKREVYKTSPELAEAFRLLDGDTVSMGMAFRVARAITTTKKLGIALTPDFILRNMFRDQLTAGTFSKGGITPFVDMVHAMGDIIGKTDNYYNWLKSGGANGTFLEISTRYLEKDIFGLHKKTGLMEATWNVVKKPVELVRVAGELAEQSTRIAEFKKVSGGASKGSKVFEGGFAAREVTVDFARMGAKMSALNSITAFLNVSIQGLDRTVRAVKENPGQMAKRAGMAITVPSILLWWANKDDPRYKNLPRWERDLFWHIMTDETVYRIPKPMELGILFGSVPERLLETYLTDNPRAMKNFEDTLWSAVAPSIVPDALTPPVEQFFNKSLFTGNPIVPHHLEKQLPAYRYTEYTSETAKAISKMISAFAGHDNAPAPVVIDNYARAWGGTSGKYLLQLIDKGLQEAGIAQVKVKPESTLADIPFVKAFVTRYPSAQAQSIVDFRDRFTKSEQVWNTIQRLAREGDVESLKKEALMRENQVRLVGRLKGLSDGLSRMNAAVQKIYVTDTLSPAQKRQMIDKIYSGMIQAAELGNQLLDEVEKKLK
jgi:hypothetical protein